MSRSVSQADFPSTDHLRLMNAYRWWGVRGVFVSGLIASVLAPGVLLAFMAPAFRYIRVAPYTCIAVIMVGTAGLVFYGWAMRVFWPAFRALRQTERGDQGRRMAATLERLASDAPLGWLDDPQRWQREARRERPLPGRED